MNKTEEVLKQMLTENTGMSMCDSGGEYGRRWQRNQGKDFDAEIPSEVSFSIYQDGYLTIEQTHSVYHWLCERLIYNEELTGDFYTYVKRTGQNEFYTDTMVNFAESFDGTGLYGEGKPMCTNSYNYESLLSQVIQYVYWEDENGHHVLLQIHGGCDVRGGYTEPKVFDVDSNYYDLGLWGVADGGIHCDNCGAYWSTDDANNYYEEGCCGQGYTNLEDMPCEEGEEGVEGVVVVNEKNEAFCPKCGKGKLIADFY